MIKTERLYGATLLPSRDSLSKQFTDSVVDEIFSVFERTNASQGDIAVEYYVEELIKSIGNRKEAPYVVWGAHGNLTAFLKVLKHFNYEIIKTETHDIAAGFLSFTKDY